MKRRIGTLKPHFKDLKRYCLSHLADICEAVI